VSATGRPAGRGAPARRAAGALAALCLLGCAKKAPPSGGPPDLEPPRLVASDPDSGAAGVALDVSPRLEFSEAMEPRSTAEAIALAPAVGIRRVRWSGRVATVALAEPLRAGRTYTLVVEDRARDRRGNPMDRSRAIVFSTADTFPPGVLAGRLEARGFSPGAATLWTYRGEPSREPDSTGRDFDALGLVDPDGGFRVPGLQVPGAYRVWVFADLNANRSFEPATDVLAEVDTTFHLGPEAPAAEALVFRVVNPRAPARVRGTVLDSLAERAGDLVVTAVADADTTRRAFVPANERLEFELQLEAGGWTLRAFRDLDRNRVWNPEREPASPALPVSVGPADDVEGIVLRLEPAGEGPE
jgi:hypothetical protein